LQNSNLQIAVIGAGGMGQGDVRNCLAAGGVKLIAACDLYQKRLDKIASDYGPSVALTRDYREVLARRDVDAIILATPDHWHATITIAALNAGKHVYCQKPMVRLPEEGPAVIAAEKKSAKLLQVGSQYVSSQVFQKANELYDRGAIGQLTLVEAWLDRNTPLGAWQYPIPEQLAPHELDWERFLGAAPKRPWEPIRFFRWRNYSDYGTGVAGDLFVHLLSGVHVVTGSKGPRRVFADGGVRYWKDGRDAADVVATMDYGEFSLVLKVNLKSGVPEEQFGVRFSGSDGVLTATYSNLRLERGGDGKSLMSSERSEYRATVEAHRLHHLAFVDSIRNGKPSVEDGVFGLRAAGPALLCNRSLAEKKSYSWDPDTFRVGVSA
jgi:predicted dehydrogenase